MKFQSEILANVLIVILEENLIISIADIRLIQLIENAIDNGILFCAVDLSKIQYMNSSGIGILTRMLAKFRNKGGDLVLIKPSEAINNLLIITKLTAIFSIVETKELAVKVLNS